MSEIPLFLRLDDVSDLDDRLVHLAECALDAGIPVLAAVIPFRLTPETAKWLIHLQTEHAFLLDIGQHGYRHEQHNHRTGGGEFCQGRTAREQEKDLRSGAAIMDEAFGTQWQHIFVPPFNQLTRSTVRLLVRMGYLGISTIHVPIINLRQLLSTVFDELSYRNGGNLPSFRNGYRVEGLLPCVSPALDTVSNYAERRVMTTDELDTKSYRLLARNPRMFGVMIHHWVYHDVAEMDVLLRWLIREKTRYNLTSVPVRSLMERLPG